LLKILVAMNVAKYKVAGMLNHVLSVVKVLKTPNKQVKNARYHSLGLLKSGALLRFLKAPYLSR